MILGLSGYARSGKDTVADHLVVEHGYTRIAFAEALKEAVYRLDPYVPTPKPFPERLSVVVDAEGWEGAKEYPEVRRLLQVMGTEVGREMFGENFWVNLVEKEIVHSDHHRWVITDCRYPSEAEMISRVGGALVRVHRPGVGPVNAHSSETGLDDWTYDGHLHNDGTIGQLCHKVDLLLENLRR